MVKAAEDRLSSELAEPLDRPIRRGILAQGQMRSEPVVVAGVGRKDPAQMGLAEDDDVIEAFPADRADQSLRMLVLPEVTRGYRVIAYAHGCETLGDRLTVGRVTVSDHVVWWFIPREGIGDLTGNPLRRGIGRYAQRYQPPPFVPEDDQNEKQPKADRRHNQDVHRADACHMVVQKGFPGLRPPSPTPRHVLGNRRLRDLDAELEKFAVDARRTPQPICQAHLPDQAADLPWYLRPTPRVRDFQRQYRRKPVRCHRMTVSGRTIEGGTDRFISTERRFILRQNRYLGTSLKLASMSIGRLAIWDARDQCNTAVSTESCRLSKAAVQTI